MPGCTTAFPSCPPRPGRPLPVVDSCVAFFVLGFIPLGLVLASAAPCLTTRVVLKQSLLTPRSYCDHCRQSLVRKMLIPVIGWLFACSGCGARGPLFYPLAESLIAVFCLVAVASGLAPLLALSWLGVHILGLAIAQHDRLTTRVSLALSVPYCAAAVLLAPSPIAESLVSLALCALAFLIAFVWSSLRKLPFIGGADLLLVLAHSFAFGRFGVIGCIVACSVFSAVGLAMRRSPSQRQPFSAYLVLCGVLAHLLALLLASA